MDDGLDRLGGGSLPLGPLLRLAGPMMDRWLARPSLAERLQERLLAVQLSKAIEGAAVPVIMAQWPAMVPEQRHDVVIVGRRGSGKTALAVAWAQAFAARAGVPIKGVDISPAICAPLGIEPVRSWTGSKDCVVLLDEASLRAAPGRRNEALWDALSLARHRGISCVWTSQSLAALHRDVLRLEAVVAFKAIDPLASRFEREEVLDLVASAVSIQTRFGFETAPASTLLYAGGHWLLGSTPLPSGWSDQVSRLWR